MKKGIYLVGGFVRDLLIGRQPKDVDYCVVGYTIEEFKAEFPEAKQVGKSFPVFLVDGDEYAFARTELSTGPSHTDFDVTCHPELNIFDDLERRDLTINAVAMCPETGYLCYSRIMAKVDLRDKILRPTSHEAFTEDPLRVLRAARFAAELPDFLISDELHWACYISRNKLNHLPKERIWKEVEKALKAPAPRRFFDLLAEDVCFCHWFPEIEACFHVPAGPAEYHPEYDTYAHIMETLERVSEFTNNPVTRFAAMCHDLGKACTPTGEWPSHHGHDERGLDCINSLCDRLGAPNKYRKAALLACKYHMKIYNILDMRPGKVVRMALALDKFPGGAAEFIHVAVADGNTQNKLALLAEACFVLPEVRIPERFYGRGKACAEILMNEQTTAYKTLKQSFLARTQKG